MSFNVSPVYVCVPHMCLVPKEARKRVSDPPGTGVAMLLEMEPGLFDNKIAQSVAQSKRMGVLPAVSCDKQRSLLRYFIAEGRGSLGLLVHRTGCKGISINLVLRGLLFVWVSCVLRIWLKL